MRSETTYHPVLPYTVLVIEAALARLRLRAVPAFSYNTTFAIVAVAGETWLPEHFHGIAGSLLGMQVLAVFAIFWLGVVRIMGNAERLRHMGNLPAERRIWTVLFDCAFVALLGLAFARGGVPGVLEFVGLVAAAIIGAMREGGDPRAGTELVLRFVIAALGVWCLPGTVLPKDLDLWPGASNSVPAAATYFGFLALFEATDFYRRLLDKLRRVRP